MHNCKSIFLFTNIIVMVAVLAPGCSSPTSSEKPALPPVMKMTAIPSSTPVENIATRVPPQPDTPPDSLFIGFVDYIRILPVSGVDLASQPTEIIKQFQQVLMTEDATWPGGTVNGIHTFSLDIHIISQDSPEVVTVKNPVHVTIAQGEPPATNLDILVGGGGGNGDMRNYAAIPLIAGEGDLLPDNPAPITLSSADVPGVYLNFSVLCQQPGIFEVGFSIPYNQASTLANGERVFSFTVNLYCPITSSLWLVDAQTGQLTNAGNFVFQDGQYIQQP